MVDIKLTDMKVIIGLCILIGGAGFTTANILAGKADKTDVKLASTKAEVALDISIESMQAKLVLLETKPNKTAYDIAKIKFLQDEIKRIRKLRSL